MKRVAIALAIATRVASADGSDAERLYNEGRALIDAGKPVEACAKFEQSLAKDPRQVGVLMNLGLCNERIGKIATALALYREAFDRATEANLAGVRAKASAEIARLTPDVPVVTIKHAIASLAGEKLVVDDKVIPNDTQDLPLDPGRHAVVVTAPGHLPFETTVTVRLGARDKLVVPALETPKPGETVIVNNEPSARRPIGKIMTVAGAAVALVGVGLAYYAKRDYDGLFGGSSAHCGVFPNVNGEPTCDDVGQSRVDHDRRVANAGLITAAAGVALALTGAALWITAPGDTQLAPTATATSVGVSLTGAF